MDEKLYSIDPFQPVVPTVYTEGLSYLEQVKRLTERVKKLDCYVNSIECSITLSSRQIAKETATQIATSISNKVASDLRFQMENLEKSTDALLSQVFEGLTETLEDIVKEVNSIEGRVQGQIENLQGVDRFLGGKIIDLSNDVTKKTTELKNEMAKLLQDFNRFKADVHIMFDALEKRLEDRVEEHMSLVNADRLIVKNPYTGVNEELQKVLREISDAKGLYSVAFDEFNSMQLTFEEFNSMGISFERFNSMAFLIFFDKLKLPSFFNYFEKKIAELQKEIEGIQSTKWQSWFDSGVWKTPQELYIEIVDFMTRLHGNPITFEDFNQYQMAFYDFNLLKITTENFNFNGKDYFT